MGFALPMVDGNTLKNRTGYFIYDYIYAPILKNEIVYGIK